MPAINANDHGPQVIIIGGIMLATAILMVAVAVYNRYIARTLYNIDSILMLLGAVCALSNTAVQCSKTEQDCRRPSVSFTSPSTR